MKGSNLTLLKSEEIEVKTPAEKAIIVTYFAFTTLSTVGFGDYYPCSEVERLVGAFLLLFGVAIFSLFMGVFIEMIDKYKIVNAELEHGDELARFFGMMKHFNGNVDTKLELKRQIEEYFDYRWKHDKNQAIDDEEEQKILEQLPDNVQNDIFARFLFQNFMMLFRETFLVPLPQYVDQVIDNGFSFTSNCKFYTWED